MSETAPRKGERTRKALLAAARRVFAEKGFLKAEIADITAVAGRTRTTFYTHIGGKTALLRALIEDFREDRAKIEHVTGERMFLDRRRELRAIWDVYRVHAPTLDAVMHAAALDPVFAEEDRDLFRRGVENDRALIRYMHSIGRCLHLDADVAGEMLATMISAVMLRQFGHAREPSEAESEAAFETLLKLVEAVIFSEAHAGAEAGA
jgi:AcrR family transcriptional regulator